MAFTQGQVDGKGFTNEDTITVPAPPDGSNDGVHVVQYRAMDMADNYETAHTRSVKIDTMAPTGDFVINGAAAYASSTAVTLDNSMSDANGLEMRFRDSDGGWTPWETYASTRAWTLPAFNRAKTVEAEFRDPAGNTSARSDSIVLDQTAPTGSFSIDDDDAYADSTAVTLDNSVSDANPMQMRFRDSGGGWTSWETYASTRSWTLPAGDGAKTVEAEYRDAAGNTSARSDSIILDQTAPTGSFVVNDDAATTGSTAVWLDNSMSDANPLEMRFRDSGGVWTSWETYAASRSWTLPAGDGAKTVEAEFRDAAGNTTARSDSITLQIGSGPAGSFALDGDAAYTDITAATIDSAATGATDMRFRDSGGNWTSWETYAATRSWTLPAGDGSKTVEAEYRNGGGTLFCSDSIVLNQTAPTGGFAINADATYSNSTAVTLDNSLSDANPMQMRFREQRRRLDVLGDLRGNQVLDPACRRRRQDR